MTMFSVDRRRFIKVTGLATICGLAIAVTGSKTGHGKSSSSDTLNNNWFAWIHVSDDEHITVYCPKSEMGQGIYTAIGMLFAEELDADWTTITVKHAPLDDLYGNQVTEDSKSVRSNWLTLRKLGAIARHQLIHAAARLWNVDSTTCITNSGKVIHPPSDQEVSYGKLTHTAANLSLPTEVELKREEDFRLIGHNIPRVDIPPMLDGSLKFTSDITFPGLLTATITHSPMPGGRVASYDDRAALKISGVKATVNLENAIAVVADNFWSAEKARQQLKIDWTPPASPALDDEVMWKMLQTACRERGQILIKRGNVDAVLGKTENTLIKEYSVPYQAHAPMEPMVCVADVKPHSCEVWAPTQSPWATYRTTLKHGLSSIDRIRERVWLKLNKKAGNRVKVHTIPMGGAFGRRLEQDFVRQAVLISKTVAAPVKLTWTREEDIRNDFYRPASYHRIQAVLDKKGMISAWFHRIAGSGILGHGADFPYDCGNVQVEISFHKIGLPTGSWRSTSHTQNAFARECFIDSIAKTINRDPVEYRLSLLTSAPRLRRTLEYAAEISGWHNYNENNIAKGVALHASKESCVVQIVELNTTDRKQPRIERVVCAIDCGLAVNPDGVKAQTEGAIAFGLSAILSEGITVRNGKIVQSNFDDFKILRMSQMPKIEIHILKSSFPPGGVGEPGVPPIAPALYNALAGKFNPEIFQL